MEEGKVQAFSLKKTGGQLTHENEFVTPYYHMNPHQVGNMTPPYTREWYISIKTVSCWCWYNCSEKSFIHCQWLMPVGMLSSSTLKEIVLINDIITLFRTIKLSPKVVKVRTRRKRSGVGEFGNSFPSDELNQQMKNEIAASQPFPSVNNER